MKRRERAGSCHKSLPENDAANADIFATINEQIEKAQKVADWVAAHPPCLSVPDASTEKEFVEKAKQVYREAHIPVLKRGPRPKEAFAIDQLNYLSEELGRQPKKNEMIKRLTNRDLLGQNCLSINITVENNLRTIVVGSK